MQFRMARAALQWTVREMQERSGVHRNTVVRIEAGEASHGPTLAAVQRALEDAGIVFLPADESRGPGVALRAGVQEPRRSSSSSSSTTPEANGDAGVKVVDRNLADFWAARPAAWAELSEEGRRVISETALGDPDALDGMAGRP